jgi:hypothetical protein
MYNKWVYFREAKLDANLELVLGDYPYKLDKDKKKLVPNNPETKKISIKKQLQKYGYWIDDEFYDDCKIDVIDNAKCIVNFCGLIACSRWCRKWIDGKYKFYTYITIGYKNGYYIDLKIEDKWLSIKDSSVVKGTGTFIEMDKKAKYGYISVTDIKMT